MSGGSLAGEPVERFKDSKVPASDTSEPISISEVAARREAGVKERAIPQAGYSYAHSGNSF
jgi:hypothetical protein